jgi:hypothetical protein
MARPRTPIGTFGQIDLRTNPDGSVRARTRFRDDDGQLRPVEATGPTPKSAERNLKEKLARRLDAIALELNDRPRQTLGFKTPSQALAEVWR